MKRKHGYQVVPFSLQRQAVAASATVGRERNNIHTFTEVDITTPRQFFREHREHTGEPFIYRLLFGFPNPKHLIIGSDIAGRVEAVGNSKSGPSRGRPYRSHSCLCGTTLCQIDLIVAKKDLF